jgi:hypothetical protein
MAIITPGQPGAVDHIDSSQGQFRDQIAEITQTVLRLGGGEVDSTSTTTLYVNNQVGSDRFVAGVADPTTSPPLTNQQITCGYSETAPFRSLQRALIEAARLSIQVGAANDLYDRILIRVAAGQHSIDNGSSTGLTVGAWPADYEPTSDDLRAFNSSDLGVILPRGVSILGADLRKAVILPTSVPTSDSDPRTERGSVFKTTGGSFFFNFTFKDVPGYTSSHHLLSAFAFCGETELGVYYQKIATAFGLSPSDTEIRNPGETQITTVYPENPTPPTDSTFGSSSYVFNCSLRSDYGMSGMFLDGSLVTGLKSCVVAQFTIVSLQRDMNAWQIYSGGTWRLPESYEEYITANANNLRSRIGGEYDVLTGAYEIDFRNFGFKLINEALIQEVSCFVIGSAVHHWTSSGAECTITNSNSNFGQTSLLSSGFRGIGTKDGAFTQDKNYSGLRVTRPLRVPTEGFNIRQISVGNVESYDAATGLLTLQSPFNPQVTFGQYGYSLKGGDYIWIENRFRDEGPGAPTDSIDVRATLTPNPYAEANPDQITVTVSSSLSINNITTIDPTKLVGSRVYVRRLVDTRTPEERQYSLLVSSSSDQTRRPVGNYILRLGGRSNVTGQLDPTNNSSETFITSTVQDAQGGLGSGSYRLTIRPGDSAAAFNSGSYYRVGTPITKDNRVFRSKRNAQFDTFSGDQWEPSLPMLPDARGVEYLRVSSGPILLIDGDLSNSPDSTDLGIDQSSYAPILDQVRSSTDFQGIGLLMRALGYAAQDIGIDQSGTLTGTVLEAQPSATRDWNPADITSPTPAGKLTARDVWPLEFNRPSLIRAFGQAYEWVGLSNYTKAMPKYQKSPLTDQHKIDVLAVNLLGGRVYNTGFTEDGLLVQGNTITDLGTNTTVNSEIAGLGALAGDPDFPVTPTQFDTLSISQLLQSSTRTELNGEVVINGSLEGSIVFGEGVLPVATEDNQGIVELASDAEVAGINTASANGTNAVTPKGLSSVRGAVNGLCDLDENTLVPLVRLPAIPVANLPQSTATSRGVIELATAAETLAFVDAERAVTPSGLGSTRGVANGFASLDGTGVVPKAQIPSLTAADLNLTPAPWVVGASNFTTTTNFTYTETTNGATVNFGDPGDMSNHLGASGFIVVTRGAGVTTPFSGIDNAAWRSAVNTWVNPTTNSAGLTGDVLIGYYIPSNNQVIYTASMVN